MVSQPKKGISRIQGRVTKPFWDEDEVRWCVAITTDDHELIVELSGAGRELQDYICHGVLVWGEIREEVQRHFIKVHNFCLLDDEESDAESDWGWSCEHDDWDIKPMLTRLGPP